MIHARGKRTNLEGALTVNDAANMFSIRAVFSAQAARSRLDASSWLAVVYCQQRAVPPVYHFFVYAVATGLRLTWHSDALTNALAVMAAMFVMLWHRCFVTSFFQRNHQRCACQTAGVSSLPYCLAQKSALVRYRQKLK